MLEKITIENLISQFGSVLRDLNKLNAFCHDNDIHFCISEKDWPDQSIITCEDVFELSELNQTIRKNLLNE